MFSIHTLKVINMYSSITDDFRTLDFVPLSTTFNPKGLLEFLDIIFNGNVSWELQVFGVVTSHVINLGRLFLEYVFVPYWVVSFFALDWVYDTEWFLDLINKLFVSVKVDDVSISEMGFVWRILRNISLNKAVHEIVIPVRKW